MRVLLANSFHYRRGGDCVQFLDLASSVQARGHEVARFCMHHPDNLPSEWSDYWVPYVEYRRRLSAAAKLRVAATSLYRPEAKRQMQRLLRDFSPDVVHFHSVQHHLTLAAVAASLDAGVPVVWTLHDYRSVCPATHLLRHGRPCQSCREGRYWHCVTGRCKSGELSRSLAAAAESYVTHWCRWLQQVDCFVAPSHFLAQTVTRMGLPARRIEVVPNPVGGNRVASLGGRREREILYVGRLSPEKGVDVLLKAVAGVPGAKLRVLGEGPDLQRLQKLAGSLALGVRVDWEGWQPPDVVTTRMSTATALAVPSICYENCPGVVLEAMAAGLPVIASELGGLVELLDAGRGGWLVPAGDAEAWQQQVEAVLADAAARRQRAAAAQRRVQERHDPTRFVERIEGIYESVVARASSAHARSDRAAV